MQRSIVSYDSQTTINDGSNFSAYFALGSDAPGHGLPVFVDRPHFAPVYTYKGRAVKYLPLQIKILGTVHSGYDTLKRIFNPVDDSGLKTLLIKDTANSDKQWYAQVTCVSMSRDGDLVTVNLAAPDPIWYSNTQATTTWTITTTAQTVAVPNVGTFMVEPIFDIKPTGAKGASQAYRRIVTFYNNTTNAYTNYPIDVTAGGLDTATLISGGKMQADGDDLRISDKGTEINRWFGTGGAAINQAGTKVWVTINIAPKIEMTLREAHSTTSTITVLPLTVNGANRSALINLPPAGVVLIDNEYYSYVGKDYVGVQLTSVVRTIRYSSAAEHTTGATIRWIEHDLQMVYGDLTLGAPLIDDTTKPIFLLTSTNAIWTYTGAAFLTGTAKRAGEWKAAFVSSLAPTSVRTSTLYSANHHTFADPATEMGMAVMAYNSRGKLKPDSAEMEYRLTIPHGISTSTFAAEKIRVGTIFPALAALEYSTNGTLWNTAASTNTASTTYATAFSATTSTFGASNPSAVRFRLKGSVQGVTAGEGAIEVDTFVAAHSATVPTVSLGAENSNYELDAKITDTGSGRYIKLKYNLKVDQTLRVDTLNHAVSIVDDNSDAYAALTLDAIRSDWLPLTANSTSTLQFDDATTGNVTILVKLRDRNH